MQQCTHTVHVESLNVLVFHAQYSALYTTAPLAGTLRIYGPPHVQDDKRYYDSCCIDGGGLGCDLFYVQRPIDSCAEYSPPFCCGKSKL